MSLAQPLEWTGTMDTTDLNLAHPYLMRQLIAYIGNKRRLLPLIAAALPNGGPAHRGSPAHCHGPADFPETSAQTTATPGVRRTVTVGRTVIPRQPYRLHPFAKDGCRPQVPLDKRPSHMIDCLSNACSRQNQRRVVWGN